MKSKVLTRTLRNHEDSSRDNMGLKRRKGDRMLFLEERTLSVEKVSRPFYQLIHMLLYFHRAKICV